MYEPDLTKGRKDKLQTSDLGWTTRQPARQMDGYTDRDGVNYFGK